MQGVCLVQSSSGVKLLSIINLIIQDEKAACNEGSLLGTWIGEDAIPCTPGAVKVRARTKLSCTRYVTVLPCPSQLGFGEKGFVGTFIFSEPQNCTSAYRILSSSGF